MTGKAPLARRVLRGLRVLMGIVTVLCLLIILADLAVLTVLKVNEAHNAWYFPYSLFVLPVLLVSGPAFLLARWALRRGETR